MPPNPHPQTNLFGMLYPNGGQPSSPPQTRHECGEIQRPCDRYSCPHNNARDDERAGRPHESPSNELYHPKTRAPVRLRKAADSCALDVADRGEHSYEQVSVAMGGTGPERVRQVELRALVKQNLALRLLEWLEPFRGRLPDGCELTVVWPRHAAAHSIYGQVEVVVTMDSARVAVIAKELGVGGRGLDGVTIRKKVNT